MRGLRLSCLVPSDCAVLCYVPVAIDDTCTCVVFPPLGIVLWVCLAYWEISLEPGIFLAEAKVTGILKPFHE